jgi:hypothetical protein
LVILGLQSQILRGGEKIGFAPKIIGKTIRVVKELGDVVDKGYKID